MTIAALGRSVARMERKDNIDLFGAVSLIGFSALLGLNQVVIKITNVGVQPVFQAGVRSFGAMCLLYLWMRFRGEGPNFTRRVAPWGILAGSLFAFEFILLFVALDFTTVARSSLMFYTMPVWLAVMAHVLIPGERLTAPKIAGLACAVAGVSLALLSRDGGGGALMGDLMALIGALGWAGIAVVAKTTPFSEDKPIMQMYWQLCTSAVILLLASLFFGPFIREFAPVHVATMGFQIVVMGALGFLFWFWLLMRYPASGVASFSFLAPIFGVGFGWLILGEPVGVSLLAALALVCLGLVLINRAAQVPQKV
ncbi:Drug/metabolite exporter family protein [Candidatus Rhodobacter oscarellae]|uniref:Drug/metabolite exporter family protein n=1 Tax=Candidatus Rhodobacter oscarellae TaxID=1675527 RepID=A0A0J9E467_9RHOB|nr:Drug/metabolite exporter family protein [Candidatus Rhodobacter lobularis]